MSTAMAKASEPALERLPADQRHNQEKPLGNGEEVVDRDDTRVDQGRLRLGFEPKPAGKLWVESKVRCDGFDGDRAGEQLVTSLPHLAHAADSDALLEQVVPDALAGAQHREGHQRPPARSMGTPRPDCRRSIDSGILKRPSRHWASISASILVLTLPLPRIVKATPASRFGSRSA